MKNEQLISQFLQYMTAKGIGKGRLNNYKCSLGIISQLLNKPFKNAIQTDIEQLLIKINEKYENPYTRQQFRITIKRFYKWLYGIEKQNVYPEIVDWFGTTVKRNEELPHKPTITKEELQIILNNTSTVMELAFTHVLYESGCRISEILRLDIKDIQHDIKGTYFYVTGKTGVRKIPLFDSVNDLNNWLEHHPLKQPNSPLWVGGGTRNFNKRLQYLPARSLFLRVINRSAITKHLTPHCFRHSRAYELKNKNFTEFEMCDMFGWKYGSKMPRIYIKPNLDSLTEKLSQLYQQKQLPNDMELAVNMIDPKKIKEFFLTEFKELEKKGKLKVIVS